MGKFSGPYELSLLCSSIANVAKIQTMEALNDTLEKVRPGKAYYMVPTLSFYPTDPASRVTEL